jgi:hypothetical protein
MIALQTIQGAAISLAIVRLPLGARGLFTAQTSLEKPFPVRRGLSQFFRAPPSAADGRPGKMGLFLSPTRF